LSDGHLYVRGGKKRELPKFERRYGTAKGKRVYGAVVGQVRRERMARGLCSVHGCGVSAVHYHGRHGCCGGSMHHAEITQSHFAGREENAHMNGPMRIGEMHGGSPFEMTNGPSEISSRNPFRLTNGPSVVAKVRGPVSFKEGFTVGGMALSEHHIDDPMLGHTEARRGRKHPNRSREEFSLWDW
jgi:hypothetical protein